MLRGVKDIKGFISDTFRIGGNFWELGDSIRFYLKEYFNLILFQYILDT